MLTGKAALIVWHFPQHRHGIQNKCGKEQHIRIHLICSGSFNCFPHPHLQSNQCSFCLLVSLLHCILAPEQKNFSTAILSTSEQRIKWFFSTNIFTPLILLLLLKSSFIHDYVPCLYWSLLACSFFKWKRKKSSLSNWTATAQNS